MNEIIVSPTLLSEPVTTDIITFEIPLNEHMRSLLRLERIFRETKRHIEFSTSSAHFFALKQIFLLLDFFERGEFKAELIKELDRELKYFTKLGTNPDVDLSKLDVFIEQLGQLSNWFKNHHGKIGHQLLKQEFLSTAKQKLINGCARITFDAPFVKLFLSKPTEMRKQKLNHWLKSFKAIQTSTEVLLRLSRETGFYQTAFAEEGFYQQEMKKHEFKFMGIRLPTEMNIYPEVSSGSKRFSIRFMRLDDDLKSEQFLDWFDFELALYT